MPAWLIVLLASSGTLALGALVQLTVSWRSRERKLPSGGGGAVLLGSRVCLVCWSYVLVVRGAVSSGLFEQFPRVLAYPVGILGYWALFAAAGGILISLIGAAVWLIRD